MSFCDVEQIAFQGLIFAFRVQGRSTRMAGADGANSREQQPIVALESLRLKQHFNVAASYS